MTGMTVEARTKPTACRYCAAPLSALSRVLGVDSCDAAACRHRAALAKTTRLKEHIATQALAQEPAAQVVWLKHCEPQLVAVSEKSRSEHHAFLLSVLANGYITDTSALAPSTADDRHPQGARLCAQCRGSCCEHGAGWHAFIDLTLLQRWQEQHADSTLHDAVQAYTDMLPESHVHGACLYQTALGCAMPRQHRADICNGFACEALQATQRAAAADPQARVVAITFHQDQVERAAVIGGAETRQMPWA
jgi:hypothetical protein